MRNGEAERMHAERRATDRKVRWLVMAVEL